MGRMRVQLQNDCRKITQSQRVSGKKNPPNEINCKGSKNEHYKGTAGWVIKLNVQVNIKQRFFYVLFLHKRHDESSQNKREQPAAVGRNKGALGQGGHFSS